MSSIAAATSLSAAMLGPWGSGGPAKGFSTGGDVSLIRTARFHQISFTRAPCRLFVADRQAGSSTQRSMLFKNCLRGTESIAGKHVDIVLAIDHRQMLNFYLCSQAIPPVVISTQTSRRFFFFFFSACCAGQISYDLEV